MSTEEMKEHLSRAEAEILLVEERLNDHAHTCPACGLDVRENFPEYITRQQLGATRTKLRRFIGALAAMERESAG